MARSFEHNYLVWESQLGESDCTPAQEQHFRTHPFLFVDPSNHSTIWHLPACWNCLSYVKMLSKNLSIPDRQIHPQVTCVRSSSFTSNMISSVIREYCADNSDVLTQFISHPAIHDGLYDVAGQ